jgi:predicted RNA-binding protein with PUA-like domain
MRYWLMKSEPSTFSIDDLMKKPAQTEPWEGVRNFQARNFMRDQMKLGDKAFFYHSSCAEPGIVGIMEIVKESYPDPTAFDFSSKYYDPKGSKTEPRWFMVSVRFVEKFKKIIPLSELKAETKLRNMVILKPGNRLSITPVTEQEWKTILKLKT